MPHDTALVTLLAVAFYFFLATRVAAARGRFGVPLPATTGNPDFERVFRVHQNTLEGMPTFLLPLWLCAIYFSDIAAAVLGLVWIGARVVYWIGYTMAETSSRGMRDAYLRQRCESSAHRVGTPGRGGR